MTTADRERPRDDAGSRLAGTPGGRMGRLKAQVPYVAVLLVAAYLFHQATQFAMDVPAGRVSPGLWPKIILGLAMLTCCYAILRNLLFPSQQRNLDDLPEPAPQLSEETPAPAEPADSTAAGSGASGRRLIWGMGITVAYAGLVSTLGFFLCTVFFLAAFMWLGSYRRPGVIVTTSLVGGLVFMYVFMKIVYVSLPLGTGPFEQVSLQLLRILGIR